MGQAKKLNVVKGGPIKSIKTPANGKSEKTTVTLATDGLSISVSGKTVEVSVKMVPIPKFDLTPILVGPGNFLSVPLGQSKTFKIDSKAANSFISISSEKETGFKAEISEDDQTFTFYSNGATAIKPDLELKDQYNETLDVTMDVK